MGDDKGKEEEVTETSDESSEHSFEVEHKLTGPTSSKMRFARRVQAIFGGTRNVGTAKLRHRKDDSVLYIVGRSMGINGPRIDFGKTGKVTGKRSHSEAVLYHVYNAYYSEDYWIQWVSSTNQACGEASGCQNCKERVVPYLGTKLFYFANVYKGGKHAHGWRKTVNMVARKKMSSETSSEDEYSVVIADRDPLAGVKHEVHRPLAKVMFDFGKTLRHERDTTDPPRGGKRARKRYDDDGDHKL